MVRGVRARGYSPAVQQALRVVAWNAQTNAQPIGGAELAFFLWRASDATRRLSKRGRRGETMAARGGVFLASLARRGLVERVPSAETRPSPRYRLTLAGRDAIVSLFPITSG